MKEAIFVISMGIVLWIIALVFAIVMKVVVENGSNAMLDLIPFVVVILLALFIHACVVLPFIGFII